LPEKIGHDDKEEARRQSNSRRKPDRHQSGFNDPPGRVGRARDHGVSVALAHHHAGKIKRPCYKPARHTQRHRFPIGGAGGCIRLSPCIALRIDHFNPRDIERRARRRLRDCRFGAKNDRNCDLFPPQMAGGCKHTLVFALRQHDLAQMPPCAIKKVGKQVHLSYLVRKHRVRAQGIND
jgi:hypothetical protein